jgi:Na+-translocating ferredoxin:NAD+ oxidoreductase subunit A
MSYLGIVVTSVFAANALLAYGLGSVQGRGKEDTGSLASALALACVNALASAFMWGVRSLVLAPLRLPSLDILFFVLLAVPLLKFVARAASASGRGMLSRAGERADDLVVGSLVFGVALLSARSGFALPEAFAASAASGLGYWLAESLLESIRERLELSDLPGPLKGAPAMLISTGLMAMALMGVDAAFVKNLAG